MVDEDVQPRQRSHADKEQARRHNPPRNAFRDRPERFAFDGRNQTFDVPAEVLMGDFVFLVQREVADILRQVVLPWQGSAFDQDRDDEEFAGEGCGDLFVDIVALAGGLALFQQLHPAGTDHRKKHSRLGDGVLQFLVETLAGQKIVDVHEDVAVTKNASETISYASSVGGSIVATITYENLPLHPHNSRIRYAHTLARGLCGSHQ